MFRKLFPLFALFALLLCTGPLHAQDEAPAPGAPGAPDAEHDLLGTWMGVTMDGEELDEGDFALTFAADGTGTIAEGGDEDEGFTYTYDPDTGRLVIFFDGEEDDAFPIDVEVDGDTATFTPTEGEEVLVARRVRGEDDADDAEDSGDAPADMSGSPLVGRWELVSFNGEAMPEGTVYVFENHPDGTGTSTVNGEPGDPYTWHHDSETGVATFTHPEQEPAAFTFVIEGDLATYTSTDETLTIVERRLGDDAPRPAGGESPLVGEWAGVSNNGEPVDPDDPVLIRFNANGTGQVFEDGDWEEPFGWAHDPEAETCTIEPETGDETLVFAVSFDGDVVTFENEDLEMFLVMRRVAVEEDGDADGEDEMGDVDFPDGPVGTWYAQKMEGEWVPADDEFRIEFREDGTAVAYENGEQEDDVVRYEVDEARRVIQIIDDGDIEVELRYDLFDDVMLLTFLVPEAFREELELEEQEQMQIVLSRRPEGNAEHQRMRVRVGDGHPANGEGPQASADRSRSMSNLRKLSLTLTAYFVDNKDTAPLSLGIAFGDGYIDSPEAFLLPWQETEVPDNWADMGGDAQAEWLDLNSGYAYVGTDLATQAMQGNNPNLRADEAAVLFELPLIEGTGKIAVAFGDGHVETLAYDEADALIEEQTGRDLMGWMDHLGREQTPFEPGGHDGDVGHGHEHDGHEHDGHAHDHAEGHGHDHD